MSAIVVKLRGILRFAQDDKALATAGIWILFLAARLPLLWVREPFFDELFTIWISRKPLSDLFPALALDSGPPLYYLVIHAGSLVFSPTVTTLRVLSLILGACSVGLILSQKQLGDARFGAAMLLALLPAHAWLSTEARSYAAAGLGIGVAALLLDRWLDGHGNRVPVLAVLALTLAAYCHYYAVLFFPLLCVLPIVERARRLWRGGLLASLLAGVLFIPGFLLAAKQPPEAIAWVGEGSLGWQALGLFRNAGFAGSYSATLLAGAPWLAQLAGLVLLGALIARGATSRRARRFGLMALIPAALLLLFGVLGRPIYFPLRFESVLAVPMVLFVAFSIDRFPRRTQPWLLAAAALLGAMTIYGAILDHARRPPDPYRVAAEFLTRRLRASDRVVASGYLYLEACSRMGPGCDRLIAFPRIQGRHPGWRAKTEEAELAAEARGLRDLSGSAFYWIGESGSLEARVLERELACEPLWKDRAATIALCRQRSLPRRGDGD